MTDTPVADRERIHPLPHRAGRAPASANGSVLAPAPEAARDGLHVLLVFAPDFGGVPRYASNLARGLLDAGWRVSVACPAAAWRRGSVDAAGVEFLSLEVGRSPHAYDDARAVRRIARWCRERDVSVIHGHSTKAGLLAALAGRVAGVPSVYTPHGWAFEMSVARPLRAGYAYLERQLASRYHAAVITVSASGRAAAERWRVTPRGRIDVVRTGLPQLPVVDRELARRELGLSPDAVVAAWVGRLGAQKRPGDLAPIARALGSEVRVVALCDGIDGTPLATDLRRAGVVVADPGCPPATIYAAADLVLHTSHWEGCPLIVLEAMSAGLPVVAYAVGGVVEQVHAGRTGHLVPRGDVEMVCEWVRALARNPARRARMGEAARARVKTMFDYQVMLEALMGTYLRIVGPAALAPGAIATAQRNGR